jgi:putative membrane protein
MDMAMGMTGRFAKEGMRPFMGIHPYSWVFQLLILVAVGLIIFWVIRGNSRENALDIIKKRYAKGEISSEEYRKIKREVS